MDVIPAIDLEGGRSRVVYWPGAAAGIGAPTDRPDRIAEQFVAQGARIIHLVDFDGARAGAAGRTSRRSGAIAARVAVPLQVAGGLEEADDVRLAFAAGATRVVLVRSAIAERPDVLRACLAVAGDWLAVGPRPAAGAARRVPLAAADAADRSMRSSEELVGAGVAPLRPEPRRRRAGRSASLAASSSGRTTPRSSSPAASATSTASAACAMPASTGVILGEALLSGAIDYPAALEAAA